MQSLNLTLPAACFILLSLLAALKIPPARGAVSDPAQDLRTPSQRFDFQKAEDPSFRRLVIPMFARVGCSARECHGSFQGRGGFQLSLFGSEWDADYLQITQKKGGEDEVRINPSDPEKSLILLKPTLQVHHKGKERFKKDSWQYNAILKWIQNGAKNDADQTGELQRLEVTPAEIVFASAGQSVQLRVVAHWNDGTVQDVTEITRFKTNDETVASVNESGLVTATGKGDSHVIASYDNGVLPVPVMLPVATLAPGAFPTNPPRDKVDELVLNKLRKMGIVPSDICTDSEFLRRVSLDLTGTLPTPEQVSAFLADQSPKKRSAKIEELLTTPAYAAWWATKFSDYTGNDSRQINLGAVNRGGAQTSRQWYDWLEKRLADNMPYDQIVSNIVLATSRSSPTQDYKGYVAEMDSYFRAADPVSFANHPSLPYYWQRKAAGSTEEKALAFAHNFLGVRMECAQCHKHPFDRWTKTDFKQFTAFFGVVAVGNRPASEGEEVSFVSITKELNDTAAAAVEKTLGPTTAPTTAPAVAVAVVLNESTDDKDKKKDAKKKDNNNAKNSKDQLTKKYVDEEIRRRVDAGGMVPWAEVFANTNGSKVLGKGNKGGNVDPKIQPKVLGGDVVVVPMGTDSRQPLMDWLRSKSNPYFVKAIVNRVWASYFNRGIVDPPDDLNIANAPANAELFNYLAEGFASHNYDLRWLHREILNSDTYQRSWRTNPTNAQDLRNFSHAVVRQLPAEVMLDAIDLAISNRERAAMFATNMEIRGIGPGGISQGGQKGKGGGGGGPDAYFLTLFGKPGRVTNCDCERSADPTLLQTIFTRNDPSLLAKMNDDKSWIGEIRAASKSGSAIDVDKTITEVFLRTVSRPPTSDELAQARADVASAKEPVDGLRDLLWAMINTREFKVNH